MLVYGAAYKVIEILTLIPFMFAGLVLPILTRYWKEGRDRFYHAMQKSLDALSLVTFPMVVGTIMLAKPIMVFIAGSEFESSGIALSILIIAAFALYYNVLFGHGIIAINKQKQSLWAYGITAIVAIIGYIIFIPRFSFIGAASITAIVETLIMFLIFFVLYRFTGFIPKLTISIKAFFASFLMGIALFFLPSMHVLLDVLLGASIYVVALYLIGGITKDMILEIVQMKR